MTSPDPVTIGRIVHFVEIDPTQPEPSDGDPWPTREWPAIVIAVLDTDAVDLHVFDPSGHYTPNVAYSTVTTTVRSWHWPSDHVTSGE